uniref:SET domain-containing protein n=1 Tax=Neogobius melanostomus TaxID=47308 RepID=A0A8C6T0E5_9GOBI
MHLFYIALFWTLKDALHCTIHSLHTIHFLCIVVVAFVKIMDLSGGAVETLDEVPPHVWTGLPNYLSLGHSAVNPNRIGVWTNRLIPKGRRFGPFVGEKKKRSQVTSNVYMWEVYFPTRGWMCVDATDPLKGNWLRYVNWARSSEEQNLFPLEINRAIYYKALRPIGPGEELLVWYSVQDNPEITAALEEERANRKNSPRAKRGEACPSTTETSMLELTTLYLPKSAFECVEGYFSFSLGRSYTGLANGGRLVVVANVAMCCCSRLCYSLLKSSLPTCLLRIQNLHVRLIHADHTYQMILGA